MTGRSVRTLVALVVAGGLGLVLAGALPWVAIELDAGGGPSRLTQYGFQNPYGILPVIGGAVVVFLGAQLLVRGELDHGAAQAVLVAGVLGAVLLLFLLRDITRRLEEIASETGSGGFANLPNSYCCGTGGELGVGLWVLGGASTAIVCSAGALLIGSFGPTAGASWSQRRWRNRGARSVASRPGRR